MIGKKELHYRVPITFYTFPSSFKMIYLFDQLFNL